MEGCSREGVDAVLEEFQRETKANDAILKKRKSKKGKENVTLLDRLKDRLKEGYEVYERTDLLYLKVN